MLKHTFLCLLALTLCLLCEAQSEAPLILVASSGKVSYQSVNAKGKQKIVDGAVLLPSGTLRLKRKGSALLLHDNQLYQVAGKGKHALADMAAATSSGVPQGNFDRIFAYSLLSATRLAASTDHASAAWGGIKTDKGTGDGWGGIRADKGTGDGWGGIRTDKGTGDGWGAIRTDKGTGDGWGPIKTDKGTGDGWGGRGREIIAVQPARIVQAATTTFRWSRPAGQNVYTLVIKAENGQPVLETSTQDTFLTLDLSQAVFPKDALLEWVVSYQAEGTTVSDAMDLVIGQQKAYNEAIKRAQSATTYPNSPPSAQMMIQAVSLEQSDFYEEAMQIYESLQKSDPSSQMVRLMHAAFWMRYGLKGKAEEAYRQP